MAGGSRLRDDGTRGGTTQEPCSDILRDARRLAARSNAWSNA